MEDQTTDIGWVRGIRHKNYAASPNFWIFSDTWLGIHYSGAHGNITMVLSILRGKFPATAYPPTSPTQLWSVRFPKGAANFAARFLLDWA